MERKDIFTALAGSASFICFGGLAACAKAGMNSTGQVSPFKIDPSNNIANVRDSMLKGRVIIVGIATGDTASSVTMLSKMCLSCVDLQYKRGGNRGTSIIRFGKICNNYNRSTLPVS